MGRFETEQEGRDYVSERLFAVHNEITLADLEDLEVLKQKIADIIGEGCTAEDVSLTEPLIQDAPHGRKRWGAGVQNWPHPGNYQACVGPLPRDRIGEFAKRHRLAVQNG